jgi:serine/threonine protein kinase
MWSIGVILYELITLKKPFEAETLAQVIHKIINEPYAQLPHDTDANLKMLVTTLLNKDHNVRPGVFTLVKWPALKKEIIEFTEKYGLEEEMVDMWEYIKPEQE